MSVGEAFGKAAEFIADNQDTIKEVGSAVKSVGGTATAGNVEVKEVTKGDVAKTTLGAAGKGASLGATVGSVVPVIGTAIGAAAGAIGGAIAGLFKGKKKKKKAELAKAEAEKAKMEAEKDNVLPGAMNKEGVGGAGDLQKGLEEAIGSMLVSLIVEDGMASNQKLDASNNIFGITNDMMLAKPSITALTNTYGYTPGMGGMSV